MNLRSHLKSPGTRMRVGLGTLILAGVTNFIVHRGAGPYRDWMDAVIGLLYGVAFGFLLLSLRSGGGTQQAPHDRG